MDARRKIKQFKTGIKLNGALREKHSFSLRYPFLYDFKQRNSCLSSPTFGLCGYNWTVKVYPIGIHETSEYLSIRLVNLSSEEVFASYSISIKSQRAGRDDLVWKDPEEILLFSGCDIGDNAWGNDELILLDDLRNNSDYTANDKIIFEVEVEVFGRDDLKAEPLSKALVETSDKAALLRLADMELLELTRQLPKLRDSVAQKQQEDGIVSTIGVDPSKT